MSSLKRREMLAALLGAPVAVAGLHAVPVGRPSNIVTLDPGAVRTDLRVYNHGDGQFFNLTLISKPWPIVGDRVRLDCKGTHLLGVVKGTMAEPIKDGSSRFFYHLDGCVLEFSGKALA